MEMEMGMDLTVGNIFSRSYIKNTSTTRLYLAKFKEKEKKRNMVIIKIFMDWD